MCAWSDPASHIWVTAEILTAANMNTYVEANLAFLGTPPSVGTTHSVNGSIANNSELALAEDSEWWKTDAGMHSTVTNNSRLICTVAGKYLLTLNVRWALNATGVRQARIKINGATPLCGTKHGVASDNDSQQSCSAVFPMVVNDYVEGYVFQTSGAALNILRSTNESILFTMSWIGF